MNFILLARKFLWRDVRTGELTLLILALLIAIASTTAISLFSDRLNRTMSLEAATFLAADLVITSPEPITEQWLKQAAEIGLATARTAEFSTVLMENNEILLAGIKAVSSAYPLRGVLKTIDEKYQESTRLHGPKPGHAWVERRVLSALKLKPGDRLQVGEKKLIISQILSYEPDKRGDLYSLAAMCIIFINSRAQLMPCWPSADRSNRTSMLPSASWIFIRTGRNSAPHWNERNVIWACPVSLWC